MVESKNQKNKRISEDSYDPPKEEEEEEPGGGLLGPQDLTSSSESEKQSNSAPEGRPKDSHDKVEGGECRAYIPDGAADRTSQFIKEQGGRKNKVRTLKWLLEHTKPVIIKATGTGTIPSAAVSSDGVLKIPMSAPSDATTTRNNADRKMPAKKLRRDASPVTYLGRSTVGQLRPKGMPLIAEEVDLAGGPESPSSPSSCSNAESRISPGSTSAADANWSPDNEDTDDSSRTLTDNSLCDSPSSSVSKPD